MPTEAGSPTGLSGCACTGCSMPRPCCMGGCGGGCWAAICSSSCGSPPLAIALACCHHSRVAGGPARESVWGADRVTISSSAGWVGGLPGQRRGARGARGSGRRPCKPRPLTRGQAAAHLALGLVVVVRHDLVVDGLLARHRLHVAVGVGHARVREGALLVVEAVQVLGLVMQHVVVLVHEGVSDLPGRSPRLQAREPAKRHATPCTVTAQGAQAHARHLPRGRGPAARPRRAARRAASAAAWWDAWAPGVASSDRIDARQACVRRSCGDRSFSSATPCACPADGCSRWICRCRFRGRSEAPRRAPMSISAARAGTPARLCVPADTGCGGVRGIPSRPVPSHRAAAAAAAAAAGAPRAARPCREGPHRGLREPGGGQRARGRGAASKAGGGWWWAARRGARSTATILLPRRAE
eukprot:scaffold7241_cov356-Prasinococcus_capsulatus_cf.AAC.1